MKSIFTIIALVFATQAGAQEVDLSECVADSSKHPAQCMVKVAETKMMLCRITAQTSLRDPDAKFCTVAKESEVLKPFYQATMKKYKKNPEAVKQAKIYYAKFNAYIAGLNVQTGDSEMLWNVRVGKAGNDLEEAKQLLFIEL